MNRCAFSLIIWLLPLQLLAADRILFVGDSLTAGFGLTKEEAYPNLVEAALRKKGYDVTVINAGISGSTTASGISRMKWHLKAKHRPTYVWIALGGNDGLRGLDLKASRANLKKIIAFAKKEKLKPILAGMKIPPNYGQKYTDEFEKMFVSVAQEEKIPLMPFLLVGVAAEKQLNLPDGIHPNGEGQKLVAKNVTLFLETILKK